MRGNVWTGHGKTGVREDQADRRHQEGTPQRLWKWPSETAVKKEAFTEQ